MSEQPVGLRERTRRAVQREITEAAERLFLERGYDTTTIADIAAEAGMSARSVFRYFPTKEDLLVGKFDNIADPLLTSLRGRPRDEPVWTSLRRMFDLLDPSTGTPGAQETARRINEVIFSTPAVVARYLQKLQLLQDSAETVLRERAAAGDIPYADDDPTPRAIVGAAFSCLLAAQHAWLTRSDRDPFGTVLDRAMAALCPTT